MEMTRNIYNSSNNESLLKSVGSNKLITAEQEPSGVRMPEVMRPSYQVRIGQVIVYKQDGTAQFRDIPSTVVPK
jgi:hypothetical protein